MTTTGIFQIPDVGQAGYASEDSLPPPTARVTVSKPTGADSDWEDVDTSQPTPPPTTPVVQPGRPAQAAASPREPVPGVLPDMLADNAEPSQGDDWSDFKIDESTGAPFHVRLDMARAQNPNEAKLVLDKYYGPGNYGQDRSGNWWAIQNGKPVAIFPSGVMAQPSPVDKLLQIGPLGALGPTVSRLARGNAAQNLAANVGASATPIAGSALGASIGTGIAPGFGTAVGAGIGAAGGWGIDQLVKWYRGLFDQKPNEFARHAINEATLNTALTGAVPVGQAIGRSAAQSFRNWVGVSPTSARMSEQLSDAGARPPIKSVAPEFKSWGDKQELRNIVAGDPWEAANTDYIRGRLAQGLRSSGVLEGEIEEIVSTASHPTIAPTRRPAGELLVQGSQRHIGNLQSEIVAARQLADNELRSHERTLRTWSAGEGRNMETLSTDVAETLMQHRQNFGNAMGRQYRQIDAMNGNERIFNLEPAWQRAREIIDRADPGSVPPYLRQMMTRYDDVLEARAAVPRIQRAIADARAAGEDTSRLEMELARARTRANGNMTTFSEGHEIRTNLREMAGEYDPVRTPWIGKIGRVEDAIDGVFSAMERGQGVPAQAAQRLRAADEQYRRGIQVFKDAQVAKLIRDIRNGIGVDPEAVASTIAQMGHSGSGLRILNMLPQPLRENVARADMRNILEEASRVGVNGVRQIDGVAFLEALQNRKRAGLMEALHGREAVDALYSLGRQLAVLDGRVVVDALPPGDVARAIRTVINRTNELDQFIARNPVGALASGTPEQVDRAVRMLSLPGNEARTIEAARFFGENSPEWRSVQRSALQGLIRSALIETPSARMTVSGPAIERILKNYTARQQELLFPNGLADDLREIAKQAKFLFPNSGADTAQSLAAKSITLHTGINVFNPRTAYADMRYLYTSMMGWLTDRPQVIRFLASVSRKNPSEGRALLGAIGRSVVNAETMTGPGKGSPSVPEVSNDNDQ